MFKVATGLDSGTDDYSVGVAAAGQALAALQEGDTSLMPSLVLMFASVKYDNATVLKGIRSIVGPDAKIAGASTAGEITAAGPTGRESVAVMMIAADTVGFETSVQNNINDNSEQAGKQLAEAIQASLPDPKFFIMLADGLKGNGSAIIRGILSVLGDYFPVAGGSAGDDGKFESTEQFHNEEVHTDSVVGVGMNGNINFSIGVNHGWNPVGKPRTVTKADGVKVMTVDNEKAISLYEEYLGPDEVENLKTQTLGEIALSYPLGIKDPNSDEMLLRAPFAVGDDGSIVCGGEIPEGSEIQLMVGTKEDAVVAAKKAAEIAKNGLGQKPQAAIIFSCHVRNTLYSSNEEAKAEVDAIQEVIGEDVPLIGFYTYAEQAPVGGTTYNIKKCNPEFHNETVVLVLLSESQQ